MPDQRERRDGERISCIRVCPYELTNVSNDDQAEFSEGRAFSVNISARGMLLLLPQTVGERQVLEIRTPSITGWQRATKLAEVRWTKPLAVSRRTTMHLAGVRFLFEAPSS